MGCTASWDRDPPLPLSARQGRASQEVQGGPLTSPSQSQLPLPPSVPEISNPGKGVAGGWSLTARLSCYYGVNSLKTSTI